MNLKVAAGRITLGLTSLLWACSSGGARTGIGGAAGWGPVGGSAGAPSTPSGGAAGAMPTGMGGAGGAVTILPGDPIPLEDLCWTFSSDLCVVYRQCLKSHYRDAEHCRQETSCLGVPMLVDAVARGAVDYDPVKAGACHAQFLESPCTYSAFWGFNIYEALSRCPGTITPRVAAGGGCSTDYECVAGLFCDKGTTYQCPGTCRSKATLGQGCSGSTVCADGLACGADKICAPQLKAGDACVQSCPWMIPSCPKGQICDGDLWCDTNIGQCQTGRLVGEPCGVISGVLVPCALNLWCNSLGFGVGTCQMSAGEGEPCNETEGTCASGLHCAGYDGFGTVPKYGTCDAPAAVGSHCYVDSDCKAGLICLVAQCAPPSPIGGPCELDPDCAEGLACALVSDNNGLCRRAAFPGDPCDDAVFCSYGRCVSGVCQLNAAIGESCASARDCVSQQCIGGLCYDGSVCQVPP